MTDKILMPVHCCCRAELLGFVPVSMQLIRPGARLTFLCEAPVGFLSDEKDRCAPLETVVLEVAELWRGVGFKGRHTHLALKSRDLPVEQLRRIDGWIPPNRIDRL